MRSPFRHRTLTIFYILVCYVLLQFGWWAWLLTEGYMSEHQPGAIEFSSEQVHRRFWMIIGEGSVFLALLLMGVWRVRKSFRDEVALSRKEKNFILSISHEFKSPLASIRLQLETLQSRKLDEVRMQEMTGMALEDTNRLTELVENTLQAARIEDKDATLRIETIDLSDLLRHTLSAWISRHPSDLEWVEAIEPGVHVSGDVGGLHSVIENLLSNAWKYSPPGGKVEVRLKRKGDRVMVEFADNGKGIPDAEKEKIFERFYRMGQEETRTSKGTGLGLYIARHLVEHHGGYLVATDNPEGGACFCVNLPISIHE
ncbi:MAG: HAMP domain-containing histidine kinase [Flavobacteriales bacterium]|nr:HAMP domain-containing histidine kinase [Flavobacteriales bacterium]MCB9449185.1 HAMP domain-containing histidine kinase [Flavobacteriales bacterium]